MVCILSYFRRLSGNLDFCTDGFPVDLYPPCVPLSVLTITSAPAHAIYVALCLAY